MIIKCVIVDGNAVLNKGIGVNFFLFPSPRGRGLGRGVTKNSSSLVLSCLPYKKEPKKITVGQFPLRPPCVSTLLQSKASLATSKHDIFCGK